MPLEIYVLMDLKSCAQCRQIMRIYIHVYVKPQKENIKPKQKIFKMRNVNWSNSKKLFYITDSRNRPERSGLAERMDPNMPYLILDHASDMTGGLKIPFLKPHLEPGYFSPQSCGENLKKFLKILK